MLALTADADSWSEWRAAAKQLAPLASRAADFPAIFVGALAQPVWLAMLLLEHSLAVASRDPALLSAWMDEMFAKHVASGLADFYCEVRFGRLAYL